MHLDNFEVEILAEDFGCLPGEPEKGVDARGIIRGPNDGDVRNQGNDTRLFFVIVAGGSDDQGALAASAGLGHCSSGIMEAEVYHAIRLIDHVFEPVSEIDLPYNLQVCKARCAGDQTLAHLAL